MHRVNIVDSLYCNAAYYEMCIRVVKTHTCARMLVWHSCIHTMLLRHLKNHTDFKLIFKIVNASVERHIHHKTMYSSLVSYFTVLLSQDPQQYIVGSL